MKKVHLICKRSNGIDLNGLSFNKNDGLYTSGSWDFSIEDAKNLIGGKIYLHETKSEASIFGGTVIEFLEVILSNNDDALRKNRIDFRFKSEFIDRGIKWGGRGYSMEWTSGIIDI